MRLFVLSASIAALAVAGAMTAGTANALSKTGVPVVKSAVEQVAGKSKKHAAHHMKAKSKKTSAWKSCGVGKYHDKTGKCADASAKKS